MTTSSTWLGPLAVSQVATLMVYPAATKSAMTPGQVGAVGMNPKERG